ncbi:hypothetical protein [Crocosphaera sp. XPORK-15E]|uniref:GNAT family N-acetyltransferase n=1 Tax=Crocosphaera sp. XPORK-15E TaxID=3110247 RepID=UPI002B20C683|nr:hypothetical protein [Crocosphaera sp. XPORK-15E]MEA5532612.1 hypothetical protein [Crocosphaera sp. XPORK-15E]
MLIFREEQLGDEAGIREVNLSAFGQTIEADIVDCLRTKSSCQKIAFVAVLDLRIVGYILFTPIIIQNFQKRSKFI